MNTLCTALARVGPVDLARWLCIWGLLGGALASAMGLLFLARWTGGTVRTCAAGSSLAIGLVTGALALVASTATPVATATSPRADVATATSVTIARTGPVSTATSTAKALPARGPYRGPKAPALRDERGRYLDLPAAIRDEESRSAPAPYGV